MSLSDVDPDLLRRGGLRASADGDVTTLTLDRPERRNAQTPATWEALRVVGETLDEGTRVVVLRGEGDAFSSGLHRGMLTPEGVEGEPSLMSLLAHDDEGLADAIGRMQEGFTWLRRPDLVSVAAVQGHAIGAGFQLALACDLRVVADDASFSMREPLLGLVPDLTGTKPLVELVGYSRALELCATGRSVSAEEARETGLATVVVPRGELDQAVSDLVAALTAPLPGAVSETKALLQSALRLSLTDQRRAEREAQVRRFRELAALSPATVSS
jgi:enoyl-CoA hydratase/carnithine racemase